MSFDSSEGAKGCPGSGVHVTGVWDSPPGVFGELVRLDRFLVALASSEVDANGEDSNSCPLLSSGFGSGFPGLILRS